MKTNKPLKAAILTTAPLFLLILFAPIEKTLGTGLRLIYLHGAWVWVAVLGFLAILILVRFLLWLFTQWLYQRTKSRRTLL
jgi:hypothetical protein